MTAPAYDENDPAGWGTLPEIPDWVLEQGPAIAADWLAEQADAQSIALEDDDCPVDD